MQVQNNKQSFKYKNHQLPFTKNTIHRFKTAQQTRVDNSIRKIKQQHLCDSLDTNERLWLDSNYSILQTQIQDNSISQIKKVFDNDQSEDMVNLQNEMNALNIKQQSHNKDQCQSSKKKSKLTQVSNCVNFLHQGQNISPKAVKQIYGVQSDKNKNQQKKKYTNFHQKNKKPTKLIPF